MKTCNPCCSKRIIRRTVKREESLQQDSIPNMSTYGQQRRPRAQNARAASPPPAQDRSRSPARTPPRQSQST
ncbi:hypothetical protein BGX38DRAFT_1279113 [Terfezia claveryi]|nr:hypothetical protein BGX38DRAFT_1279113 [Terfezia claveryi]